ncbi:hypothetical protein [Pseudanabaena sp. UWO311]
MREYGEVRQNYQQVLAIKIEFGDLIKAKLKRKKEKMDDDIYRDLAEV